jgi:hypothetical protein
MGKITFVLIIVVLTIALIGGDGVLQEAVKAIKDGRIINNEMMSAYYPSSFRPGTPPYLERDFEAGANFICDEIKVKLGRDLCAETDINWRR